jgi:hypothetical protein
MIGPWPLFLEYYAGQQVGQASSLTEQLVRLESLTYEILFLPRQHFCFSRNL